MFFWIPLIFLGTNECLQLDLVPLPFQSQLFVHLAVLSSLLMPRYRYCQKPLLCDWTLRPKREVSHILKLGHRMSQTSFRLFMRSTPWKIPYYIVRLAPSGPHRVQLGHKEWGDRLGPLLRPEEASRGRLQNAGRPERSSGRKAGSKLKKIKKQTVNLTLTLRCHQW